MALVNEITHSKVGRCGSSAAAIRIGVILFDQEGMDATMLPQRAGKPRVNISFVADCRSGSRDRISGMRLVAAGHVQQDLSGEGHDQLP